MIGSAAWVQYRTPKTLASIIRRHSSVGAPAIGPSSITPALLTSASRRPSSAWARWTNAAAWSSCETSVAIATARPPSPLMRSASASMRSVRRAASATAAPASAQASAVASPMPDDAPVIATTCPLRSKVMAATVNDDRARPMTGSMDQRPGRIPCLARRLAPFGGAALLAFLLVIPEADLRWGEFAAAAAITVAVVLGGALLPWRRWPGGARVAPALLFLVAVFLLRDAAGAATAGVGTLAMLPVFWLAMHGTRAQLLAILGGVVAYWVAPVALIGGADYPLTQLRAAAIFVTVAGIIGLTVQRLYQRVRSEASASRRRERDL